MTLARLKRLGATPRQLEAISPLTDAGTARAMAALFRELQNHPSTPAYLRGIYRDAIAAHEAGQPIPDAALVAAINA